MDLVLTFTGQYGQIYLLLPPFRQISVPLQSPLSAVPVRNNNVGLSVQVFQLVRMYDLLAVKDDTIEQIGEPLVVIQPVFYCCICIITCVIIKINMNLLM